MRLWEFLDRELSVDLLAEIEAHVARCDQCGPHAAFGRAYKAAVRSAQRAGVAPAAMGDRVRAALLAAGFQPG
jgi:anti-sigma factor RsiW